MGGRVRPVGDPDLVYEYRPGIEGFTNSAGFRGREYPVEKPPDTIRIAGLGDSVMAGEIYPAEKTFMGVLEKLLNEAATSPTRFETLNFAVGGYDTVQELAALRLKALAYGPDWVILGVVINDIEPPVFIRVPDGKGGWRLLDRFQIEDVLPYATGLDPARLPWWAHSVFLRWLRMRFYWPALRSYSDSAPRWLFGRHSGWVNFKRALAEMARICRAHGIRMLVVILTEDVEVGRAKDPRAPWHRAVARAAREQGLYVLETYPAILAYLERHGIASYRRFWSGPQDPHPSEAGHRLLAELIFEKLKSLGILEEKPRRKTAARAE